MREWTYLHQLFERLDGWLNSPVENDEEFSSRKSSMRYESTLFAKCISTRQDTKPNKTLTSSVLFNFKRFLFGSSSAYWGLRAKSVGTQEMVCDQERCTITLFSRAYDLQPQPMLNSLAPLL